MATIVHTREKMLQNSSYLNLEERAPKNFYTATQPWTNLFTNPDNPNVSNLTKTLFSGIQNPFDNTGSVKYIPTTGSVLAHSLSTVNLNLLTPFVSGAKAHLVVYVKSDGSNFNKLALRLSTNGTTARTVQYTFDPGTGNFVGSFIGNGWSNMAATVTILNNNWYKVIISGKFTPPLDETTVSCGVLLTDSANATTFIGNGNNGLYLYGFQAYYNVDLPDTVIGDTWYNTGTNSVNIWTGYNFTPVTSSIVYDIESSTTVIYKNASSASESGTYASFTVTGKKTVGTTKTTFGFLTVTGNGGTEAAVATADSIVTSPSIAAGTSFYDVKLYDTSTKTTLLKSLTIPVVFKGNSPILIDLDYESNVVFSSNDLLTYTAIPNNNINLLYNGADITSGVTYGPQTANSNGLVATVNTATGLISYAGSWTTTDANFTFYAVYLGTTYTTKYSVAKSPRGSNAILIDLDAKATVVSSSTDLQTYNAVPANNINLYSGGTELTSGVTYGPQTANSNGLVATVNTLTGAISFAGTWTGIDASFTFTATYAGTTYSIKYTVVKSPKGITGDKIATIYLYRWDTTQPNAPTGSSTYDWTASAHINYTPDTTWSVSPGANPGISGVNLWVAATTISAQWDASTTSIVWNGRSNVSIYSQSVNAPGTRTATVIVYQWALSGPPANPPGTTTYTWLNGAYAAPSGWSLTPGTPTAGYTLWGAAVNLIDSSTATTTSIDWNNNASVTARGYSGLQGGSVRTAYARIAANPAASSSTAIVAGDARPALVTAGNFIIGAIYTIVALGNTNFAGIGAGAGPTVGTVFTASGAGGVGTTGTAYPGGFGSAFQVTWSTTDPNPSSNDSLYQMDGVYDPSTARTTWASPYISSLKVGSLSAITVNTGSLTVNGGITMTAAGSIAGGQTAYSTGNGFFLGYDSTGAPTIPAGYKFSIGNGSDSTKELTWDGTTLSIPSASITGTLTAAQIGAGAITAAKIAAGAITTDKILVTGRGTALNDDPGTVDISAWLISPGAATVQAVADTPVGTNTLRGTNGTHVYSKIVPVDSTKRYRIRCWVRAGGGATGTFYLRAYWYDQGNANTYGYTTASSANGINPGTTWVSKMNTTDLVPPAGATGAAVAVILNYTGGITGYHEVADLRLEELVGADLIVDGSITGDKLAVNSITAGSAIIGSGAISNAQIGNLIQSTDYAAGSAGWAINKTGTAEFNIGTFRGAVNVGDFTGYAWPAAGKTGAHLSSLGLAIGNANTLAGQPSSARYFEVYSGGTNPANAYISTNIPAFVNTINIGNNQVTIPLGIYTITQTVACGTAEQTVQTLDITSSGARILVFAGIQAYQSNSSEGYTSSTIRLKRALVTGGVPGTYSTIFTIVLSYTVGSTFYTGNPYGIPAYGGVTFPYYSEILTAAQYRYIITVQEDTNGSGLQQIRGSAIQLLEAKR